MSKPSASVVDGEVLLDPLSAARRLRITPELLMSFVKVGATRPDGSHRLAMVEGDGRNLFRAAALDAFDAELWQPWSYAGAARPAIPKAIHDYLKVEAGGGCARCIVGSPLEEAHIEPWERTRSHHPHNLLRLCRNCHRMFDDGVIAATEIAELKQRCIDTVQRRLAAARPALWPIPGAPPLSRQFLGRDEEAQVIENVLSTGHSLIIEGVGGIGKTQVALHALRKAASARPIIWISVEDLVAADALEEVIQRAAHAAGVAVTEALPLALDEARSCIVFDGLERSVDGRDTVADFIERLAAETSDTQIIVTTQVSLPGFIADHRLLLRPLTEPSARDLLLIGNEQARAEPGDGVDKLLAFAEGHPLSLSILSALLRHFGSAGDVAQLLARQGARAVRTPGRTSQSATTALELSLAIAHGQLSEDAKWMFWATAMSPGGLRPAMGVFSRRDIADPIACAAELRSWNLVEMIEDPQFDPMSPAGRILTMLSPVRSFALAAAAALPADVQAAREHSFAQSVAAFCGFLQSELVMGGRIEIGMSLMERELPNVMAVFDIAERRLAQDPIFMTILTTIANSTMMFLFTAGRFTLGRSVMYRAAAATASRGDLTQTLQFLLQMQVLAQRAGDEKAAAFALTEAERLGSDSKGEPLALLRQLQAHAAEQAGDHSRAAEMAHGALTILDGLEGEQYQAGFAAFQVGRALEFSGEPGEALPYYLRALAAFEEERDPVNLGSALHHIGNCKGYLGNWKGALDAYHAGANRFAELGAVEYLSNALGEAGLILPMLDPLANLPDRELIAAGLADVVERIERLMHEPEVRRQELGTSLRKLAGVISLAVHSGNRDLLEHAADALAERILRPWLEDDDHSTGERILIFHVQWLTRLCAFLALDLTAQKPLADEELKTMIALAARGFPMFLHEEMAQWMSSFLVRIQHMPEMTPGRVHAALDEAEW